MDLNKDVPRSPYERLGGIVFLPRAIDKGRADLDEMVGEYSSRTGFSKVLFDFLGVSAENFIDALRKNRTDEGMWEWVSANMAPRTADEIEDYNRELATRTPQTPEQKARHKQQLEDMGQGHRTDVARMFDWLDLDEGRDVPQGGRQDY